MIEEKRFIMLMEAILLKYQNVKDGELYSIYKIPAKDILNANEILKNILKIMEIKNGV